MITWSLDANHAGPFRELLGTPQLESWIREHGFDPDDCYRIEIHKSDPACHSQLLVYRYLLDRAGSRFCYPDTNDPAIRPVAYAELTSPPPEI